MPTAKGHLNRLYPQEEGSFKALSLGEETKCVDRRLSCHY